MDHFTDENRVSMKNIAILQDIRDSYKLLKCHKEDSANVVKKKYLKLAKKFHPDTVYGQAEDIIKDYTHKFQKIRDAYAVIQNSQSKVA